VMVLTLPRLFEMREGGCCGAGGGGHPVFQPGSSRCCLSELRQVSSPLSSNIVKVSRVSRTLLLTSPPLLTPPLLLTPPPPSPPQPPPLPQVLGLLEEAARNCSRPPSIPSTSGPSPPLLLSSSPPLLLTLSPPDT
jgi:hypothetical protein